MQTVVPLACFLSAIRPPGVQYENSLLQIAPVDKSLCPYIKGGNDVGFQLFTRHNPTVYQELKVDDDEKLFASNIDFHDQTVLYFHAWMETPEDGSGVLVREAYMQRGDTNVIMVDARSLQAGPWYFTAAQNTWYIGRFAGQFIDYLVTRGLNLNNTHLVGHSLGAHVAGVAGTAIQSGKVARITGLDAALPLFDNLPLSQRLDPSDAMFVDTIHTDAGIFGYKAPLGHVDFYPNAGISPQPGCELEVVIPKQLLLNKCDARKQTNGFYTYYLRDKREAIINRNSLEYKLEKLFAFIQSVRDRSSTDSQVTLDKVKDNIISLNRFKDSLIDYLNYDEADVVTNNETKNEENKMKDNIDPTTIAEIVEVNINDTADAADIVVTNNETKNEENNKMKDNKTTIVENVEVADQIAQESGANAKIDELGNEKKNDDVQRRKREADNASELTVTSGNLTLREAKGINLKDNKNMQNLTDVNGKTYVDIDDIVTSIKNDTKTDCFDKFKTNLDDKVTQIKEKMNKKKITPVQFNLFRRRPILRQIIRILPRIIKKDRSKNKKYGSLKTRGLDDIKTKIGSKFKPANSKLKRILKRQKRFLPFFQRTEDSNSILFKMLDFLVKNRKNVLPVFTVMREINTLVKSANGELNHFSKESNNYIGATPPVFTPISYTLELGNENRVMAFVKRILGVAPKGDRLTIGSGK